MKPLNNVSKAINCILKPFGLRLCRANNKDTIRLFTYLQAIEQLCESFKVNIFHELPSCNRRVELMAKLIGTELSEALYLIAFLHKSLMLEGDICEFGVAEGATSALLANEIISTQKSIWCFDSFKGLPKPSDKDILLNDILNLGSIHNYQGAMCSPISSIRSRLSEIAFPGSRAKIIPGYIEATILSDILPQKVCFAYIDFDFYNPTIVALNFLHNHMSVGGYIIIDDYGVFSSGVKTAVAEFLEKHKNRYHLTFPHEFAGHFCMINKIG